MESIFRYFCIRNGVPSIFRLMNNIATRTVYGFFFLVIIIGAILISPYLFALVLFVVNILGINEILAMMLKSQAQRKQARPFVLTISSLVFVTLSLHALGLCDASCLLLLIPLFFLPYIHVLFSRFLTLFELFPVYLASLFLVSVPAALMLFFYNPLYMGVLAGPFLLLAVLFMIWINDIFAYLFGIWLGKHRLFERISPKKSWEGSIGGLAATLLFVALAAVFTDYLSVPVLMGMTAIVVVFGSLGDLIESMLKRQTGVKDSGTLIPGHGGILDRFDAGFFAIPFVFTYLSLIL